MESSSIVSQPGPQYHKVLIAGVVSSALTLLAVYFLNKTDLQVMDYWVDGMIPIGLLLAGMMAGSGYGIASFVTGTKITKNLLWIIVGLQFFSYFAAKYIEFHSQNLVYKDSQLPISFWDYTDTMTRSFSFVQDNGKQGGEFGVWGYGMLALEVAGFCVGGLVAPLILRSRLYCESCQVYMKNALLMLIPASLAEKKFKKTETEARAEHDRLHDETLKKGDEVQKTLREQAQVNHPEEFKQALEAYRADQKAILKLPVYVQVNLSHCPHCRNGIVGASVVAGKGENRKTTGLWSQAVQPGFVEMFKPSVKI